MSRHDLKCKLCCVIRPKYLKRTVSSAAGVVFYHLLGLVRPQEGPDRQDVKDLVHGDVGAPRRGVLPPLVDVLEEGPAEGAVHDGVVRHPDGFRHGRVVQDAPETHLPDTGTGREGKKRGRGRYT